MPEKDDDPSVLGSEIVLRRVPNVAQNAWMVVDEATRKRRPTTAVFEPDADGVSVYRRAILAQHDLDDGALVRDPLNGILALQVDRVRKIQLGVAADPYPPDSGERHDRDAAHALIVGLNPLTRGQRKKKKRELVDMCDILRDPADS